MKPNFSENTLRDYLRSIFRHKVVFVVTFVIIMMGVAVGLEIKTPVYETQVKMLVSQEKHMESPYYTVLDAYQHFNQSEIVNSNSVIERAVKALKLHERPRDYEKDYCSPLKAWLIDLKRDVKHKISKPENISPELLEAHLFRQAVDNLKSVVKAEPIKDTNLFTISASDFSPNTAAAIANVVSRSYVIFCLEQQLAELQLQYGERHPTVQQLKNEIIKLAKNLHGETLPAIEAIGPASVKIIEQAQVPLMPTGTSKGTTLLLAFFMGSFFAVILAFGTEYIDHTFKTPKDAEVFLNLPLLGSIPRKGFKNNTLIGNGRLNNKLVENGNPTNNVVHYQNLSDQTYLLMKDKNIKSILVTAPSPLEGSTTIIANLGNFLSNKAGHRVMIIDANLRDPAMHKVFKISDNPGLANVLEGKISLEKASQNISPNLTVLPAGNTSLNPFTLLNSSKMLEVIKSVKEQYEIVFVDYANLKNIKEVCILSSCVDGIALVVNEGKTRSHVIKSLITPLEQKKSNMIGFILNNRTFVIPKMIYERV